MTETTLPTEDFIPEIGGVPMDFNMVLFGPPKSGKTTFGASWPRSILLECEAGGAKYIKCRKIDINSLVQLREVFGLLKDNNEYETIVIDSLDRVAQWIEDEICQELDLKNIMDAKKGERHGAQWGFYAQRVLGFLEAWKSLGKRNIFLAHTKKAETDGNGMVISPKTINLYGQAANRVLAIVDNIGYLYAVENEKGEIIRYLSFRAGLQVEAGSRHPALTDKKIELPKVGSYEAFAALFNVPENGAVDTKKAKKQLALAKGE